MNHYLEQIFGEYLYGSGPGSTIEYTQNLRQELNLIFKKYEIKSLLDVPCGDMVWMKLVLEQNKNIKYIGGDIVYGLIERHKQNFQSNNISFIHIDITEDALPTSDLWIARDVLFHLAPENVMKVFENFLVSDIKYILTTTHGPESIGYDGLAWTANRSIPNCNFALLNLFADPYNFCQPLYRFDDTWGEHPKREMCLWTKDQIRQSLNK